MGASSAMLVGRFGVAPCATAPVRRRLSRPGEREASSMV
ncbi:hypothetical protein I546_1454 [Mycobacterium kansasii 732]|nr:hypothetical protein I546_1454 [Mycobacterium kansasii 732]